jgi:hypothetical protein
MNYIKINQFFTIIVISFNQNLLHNLLDLLIFKD